MEPLPRHSSTASAAERPSPIAPLLVEDLPQLRRIIESRFHERGRSDHRGRAAACVECDELTDTFVMKIVAKATAPKNAWDRDTTFANLRGTTLKNLLSDTNRSWRSSLGGPSRPDRIARHKDLTHCLRPAVDDGSLSVPIEVASKIIEYAIVYAVDPGERREANAPIPFGRISRSLTRELGDPYTALAIQQAWSEIVALSRPHPPAWKLICRWVLDRDDRLDEGRLFVGGDDGGEALIEDVVTTRSLTIDERYGCDPGAQPGDEPAGPPAVIIDLIDRAADRFRSIDLGRRCSAARRDATAATCLMAEISELQRQHDVAPITAADVAEEVFDTIVNQVIAVATYADTIR